MNDTAETQSKTIELLTFRLADQEYSLDIISVREIRSWTQTTPLPHSPSYMKGVINLRGTVLPVMDLADRLGLPPLEKAERNVIIVAKLGDKLTGLLVDAVSDIIALTNDDLQPPPDLTGNTESKVVSSLTVIDDRMIRVLDIEAVINNDSLIAA